ncbi:MAG: hypothetical protein K6C07_06795, partial [Bacteroidales bacterium]|nr:hypothetical protein [Bacteroidales bacterium]
MEGLSSNDDFNKAIKNTDQKRRVLSAEKGKSAYQYKIASLGVKKKFLNQHGWVSPQAAEEE